MIFDSQFFESALALGPSSLPTVNRIWTDTRTLKNGDLFVAILGKNFDGHQFINQAAKAGAVAALVQKNKVKEAPIPLIEVEDTVFALRALAKKYRETLSTQIIAIGGSNGKTTTKEWAAHLFTTHYGKEKVFKTLKSQNSILGIAMSLLQIRSEDYAILEIGIDEPGWMKQHLEIVNPDFGVLTNIAEEHLAGFGSLETIEKEEGFLLDYLQEKSRPLLLNCDDERLLKRKGYKNALTFGLKSRADLEGLYQRPNILHCFGEEWLSPLPGEPNAMNLLAAIGLLQLVSKDLQKSEWITLKDSCQNFKGEPHRGQWLTQKNGLSVFDDCYNANPKSVLSSLSTFLDLSEGVSRAIVLGDMLDLGGSSTMAHQKILNRIQVLDFDKIYLYGEEFEKAASTINNPQIHTFGQNFEALKQKLKDDLISTPFDCLMLKGSRGMRLERLLELFEWGQAD